MTGFSDEHRGDWVPAGRETTTSERRRAGQRMAEAAIRLGAEGLDEVLMMIQAKTDTVPEGGHGTHATVKRHQLDGQKLCRACLEFKAAYDLGRRRRAAERAKLKAAS